MKCEDAQRLIVGDNTDPKRFKREEALRHAETCRECGAFLEFDRRLTASLDVPVTYAPDHLLASIRHTVTIPEPVPARSWISIVRSPRRSLIMKRITVSAATAAILSAAFFGVISQSARASEPKAKFEGMKNALLATSHKTTVVMGHSLKGVPGQSGTMHFKSSDSGDGAYDFWFVQDGELKEASAKQGSSADDQVMMINGKEIRLKRVDAAMSTGGHMSLDLNAAHYKEIRFGLNENSLVLTPATLADTRFTVKLNPATSIPLEVTKEQLKNGKWTKTSQAAVKLR